MQAHPWPHGMRAEWGLLYLQGCQGFLCPRLCPLCLLLAPGLSTSLAPGAHSSGSSSLYGLLTPERPDIRFRGQDDVFSDCIELSH